MRGFSRVASPKEHIHTFRTQQYLSTFNIVLGLGSYLLLLSSPLPSFRLLSFQSSFSVALQARRYRLCLALRCVFAAQLVFLRDCLYVLVCMCCVLLGIVIAVGCCSVVVLASGQRRLSLPTGSVVCLCRRAASSPSPSLGRSAVIHVQVIVFFPSFVTLVFGPSIAFIANQKD